MNTGCAEGQMARIVVEALTAASACLIRWAFDTNAATTGQSALST
jgi:hypothetical protein